MDVQNFISNCSNVQLVINLDELKEICSYLYNEERIRQEKLKEQENGGMLDSKQVMEQLKVKSETLWRWHKTSYLRHVKVGCRNYYKREDVEKILIDKDVHGDD